MSIKNNARLRRAKSIDLHDPGNDGAARRLPDQRGGEAGRQEQRAEGHDAPVPGLDAG